MPSGVFHASVILVEDTICVRKLLLKPHITLLHSRIKWLHRVRGTAITNHTYGIKTSFIPKNIKNFSVE